MDVLISGVITDTAVEDHKWNSIGRKLKAGDRLALLVKSTWDNAFSIFELSFSVSYVDDGTSGHSVQYVQNLAGLIVSVAHNISQILALKTHSKYILLFEMKTLLNVFHDFGSSCCCESKYRNVW